MHERAVRGTGTVMHFTSGQVKYQIRLLSLRTNDCCVSLSSRYHNATLWDSAAILRRQRCRGLEHDMTTLPATTKQHNARLT